MTVQLIFAGVIVCLAIAVLVDEATNPLGREGRADRRSARAVGTESGTEER